MCPEPVPAGLDPVKGSEQGGLRPALIVQNDIGNRYSPTTVVAAITRTIPPQPYPFVVVIEPEESGLPERSAVNCAQVATIQQSGPGSRLRPPRGQTEVRPIGQLGLAKLTEVEGALRFNWTWGDRRPALLNPRQCTMK